MNNLFSYLIEASLILLVLFSFYFLVLRHKANPAFNRFYLLFSIMFMAVIPLLSLPVSIPESLEGGYFLLRATRFWSILPELVISGNASPTQAPEASIAQSFSVLSFVYFSGALISLLLSFHKFIKLHRLVNHFSFRRDEQKNYLIAETNGELPTFSFLSYIFWDNTVPLNPTQKAQILKHELGHIKQKHSLDLLLLELMIPIFWFNPFIYAIRHSLLQVHEHLADRFAIEGTDTDSYLKLMVQQSLRQANIPLTSSFFQHNTINRLRMLQTKSNRTYLRAALGAFVLGGIFFVASCQDDSIEPQSILVPDAPSAALPENPPLPSAELVNSETIFEVVEEMPVPTGGMEALYKTIGESLVYPQEAITKGIEGRVFIQFVLEKDGTLSELKAVKGVGHGCDEAAIDAIKATSGQWEPGRQGGKAARTRMIMPIVFKL